MFPVECGRHHIAGCDTMLADRAIEIRRWIDGEQLIWDYIGCTAGLERLD